MNISKLKKSNVMVLEVLGVKVVWFIDPVSDPLTLAPLIPEGTRLVLVNPEKPFVSAEDTELWDITSQNLKREKNVVLVYSTGEYGIEDINVRGSNSHPMAHYVLKTPEGSVGFFQSQPSDNFLKEYAPIDVVIGRSVAIAGAQLDLEPFYVILTEITEEYKTKSGVSDIKEVDHVNVKRISQEDRDGVISISVNAII